MYVCQSSGSQFGRWLGRCTACQEWHTVVEERVEKSASTTSKRTAPNIQAVAIDLNAPESETDLIPSQRYPTGLGELDRVLGGGLVRDSFILLGGDPGIGKSTLLLQLAFGCGKSVLYVSGEESVEQLRSRAKRLYSADKSDRTKTPQKAPVHLLAETVLERALEQVRAIKPDIVIMDSLQTFASESLESAPGSVGQLREIAHKLMHVAKQESICVWLVGHVTKDGAIAGPKVVEHMVDTVLYFEGEELQDFRLLRAIKNRFGNARELGVFEMSSEGLREVGNPSQLFLSERRQPLAGVATTAIVEGSRCLLIELQALVAASPLSLPRRTSVGMEPSRLSILAAIVERHMRITISQQDLFFNVSGGLKLSEPAADLAATVAIWSSARNHPVPSDWLWLGEVGLTGEIRRVSQPELRIEEAHKLGFKKVILPASTLRTLKGKTWKDLTLTPIQMAYEVDQMLSKTTSNEARAPHGERPSREQIAPF